MEKKGIKPRDHARDNIVALREKQKENRQRRLEPNPKAAEWKMQQFKNIPSKLKVSMEASRARGAESPRSPDERADFLRRGSLEVRQERERKLKRSEAVAAKASSPAKREPLKQPVPRAREVNRLAPRSNKDFVGANRTEARQMEPKRRQSNDEEVHRHSEFGAVPKYLQDRKEEWAETEARRQAALPDPSCPPGMRLMPEDERLETLDILLESEREAQSMMLKLPLHSTTPSVVKRKEALEAKLKEIEAAKKIFSKARVYIKED